MNWHGLSYTEQYFVRRKLEKHIHSAIPGFEILNKKQSLLINFMRGLMFFKRRTREECVVAIYPNIYVSETPYKPYNHLAAIEVLAHEYVHLKDCRDMSLIFNFLYLSPQILSVFGFLGLALSPWFLLFFLFILPWPSPGRAWLEIRAYRMSLAILYWFTAESDLSFAVDHFTHQFASSNYYWMMPFKKLIHNIFTNELDKIKNNQLTAELKEIKLVLGI